MTVTESSLIDLNSMETNLIEMKRECKDNKHHKLFLSGDLVFICVKGREVPSDFSYKNYMRSLWITEYELLEYFYAFRKELNWKTSIFSFLCLR